MSADLVEPSALLQGPVVIASPVPTFEGLDGPDERDGVDGRLGWLRAAVLGADDGIVSVAGIIVGVAGATSARGPILTAGLAGLVAGAASMALGEYVSVSGQRDGQLAALAALRGRARAHDAHPGRDLAHPWQAATASALAFTAGAILPLLAVLIAPAGMRVPATVLAVLVALAGAGALSARLGGSSVRRSVLRVVLGGALALAFTYGVGRAFGASLR